MFKLKLKYYSLIKRLTHTSISRIIILTFVLIYLFGVPAFPDAPVEKFYVSYSEIDEAVLKKTIGVLTIVIPNTRPDEYEKKCFVKHNVSPFKGLKKYKKESGSFIFNGTLNYQELKPVSGWEWGFTEIMRFPVYEKHKNYLLIVYDPIKSLTAWINLETIPDKSSFYGIDELYFKGNFKKYREKTIDIFSFMSSKSRKLYKQPSEDADSIIIPQSSSFKKLLDPGFATVSGYCYFFIMEIKNGFILIGIDEYDKYKKRNYYKPVGWIKIRDSKNRFTIWPVTGRS